MLSNLLGLTIDKGDLNKTSPTPVVNTLKKTATNYLAIGKMAEDLKVIKLNFSRYLASQGVKVRGTPDMHFLKDDERAKKFNVLREKYTQSKLSKEEGGGSGLGSILIGFIGYKFRRTIERKVTAAVLKRYRKMTAIRQLVRFKRKLMSGLNKLLVKINIKKIFSEWFSKNSSKILKPLIGMFTNSIKRFVKKGLTKLIQRATVSVLSAAWAGPFLPFVAGAIFVGLTLWEPVKEAWESYTKGDDFMEKFIISVIDSFTFGIFGEENIKTLKDSIAEWMETMSKKVSEAMNSATEFVKNKMTEFTDFIIEKAKSVFTMQSTPENFKSSFEELNSKRMKEESEMVEKYGKYFDEMGELIEKTKIRIAQYKVEIAILENEIKGLTEGPEKTRLDEVKVEKAKEEQKLVEQEIELKRTKEGGGPTEETKPVVKKTTKKEVKPPAPVPAAVAAPVAAPKPVPATVAAPVAAPTKKDESNYDEEPTKGKIASAEEFVSKMFDPAKKAAAKLNVPVLGLLAQWAVEAGWGSKPSGDYNYFGLKSFGKPPQKLVVTTEENLSKAAIDGYKKKGWFISQTGNKVKVKDLFKNYSSVNEGVTAQAEFLLTNPRYSKAGVFGTKTPLEYGEALKKAGYATASNYAKTIDEVSKSLFKRLAQADKVQFSQNREFLGPSAGETKLTEATSKPTTTAASGKFLQDESKQVAQAQREQLKPKDVDVVKVSSVNNVKQTKNQNVASSEKVDSLEIVTGRAV